METHINDLNDDCLLEVLRLLHLNDVLSFGTMNVRFSYLVINNYDQSIRGATIYFNNYDQRSTPHIIQLFGQFMRALEIHFFNTIVPSILFANEDECFVNNIQQMRLCVVVFNEVDASLRNGQHFLFNHDQFVRWVQMYKRTVFNIVDFINQNDLTRLVVIRFKFAIQFWDLNSYNQFSRYWYDFLRIIERISAYAFRDLRRGNMDFDQAVIPDFYRFKFNLNFLPENIV